MARRTSSGSGVACSSPFLFCLLVCYLVFLEINALLLCGNASIFYSNNSVVKLWESVFAEMMGMVWQLFLRNPPQMPAGSVLPEGFTEWPTENMQRVVAYMERQWFNPSVMQSITWWCHWDSGYDRTSNAAEAFHSLLFRYTALLLCGNCFQEYFLI